MSVLPCFVQRRRRHAEQTQTRKGIWMLEEALGHFSVRVLSQIPSAHPHCQTYVFQSCSGAVLPGTSAGHRLGTHHVKPRGSSTRKTILHVATNDALHTWNSSGTPALLQGAPETPTLSSAWELLEQVFNLDIGSFV